MWKTVKHIAGVVLQVICGMWNPEKARQKYEELFAQDMQRSRQRAAQDMPFSDLVDELLNYFGNQMGEITAVMGPSMLARKRIEGMFKKDDVEDLLVALEMDLKGNPTSEMGHMMFSLAQSPEVQEAAAAALKELE